MRFVLFVHSLVSCWNHGNAHFLRGVAAELVARGHDVAVYEQRAAWSRENLEREHGPEAVRSFAEAFPTLASEQYDLDRLDLDRILDRADVVLVHEWNDPTLVAAVGRRRGAHDGFVALFHDTHHRAATAPEQMARYDLSGYDGVLAFGEAIRRLYLERGWADRAWTWHEAADTRIFRPLPEIERRHDIVWIGNWGDDERTAELAEFLLLPARELGLTGSVYGVRYPDEGRRAVEDAGLAYRGWIANHEVPGVFAAHRVTVHVPRRPYTRVLPGIPTIRPFEALACGIPLVSAPWDDAEGLFTPGEDFLLAGTGAEMTDALQTVLHDRELAGRLARRGLETIVARHTCAHRVDELLGICRELGAREGAEVAA
ncbi:MAG: glycosyltransferase [Actinomycetota bacterium]|nr:glycosyltransferase [Actinomycetota bacterium]